MAETHFDDWVASRYQKLWPELFEPAVVDPAGDFLTDLAAAGPVLEPGGLFVIENYIPALQHLSPGDTIRVFTRTPAHLGFEEYDVATQIAISHHYFVIDGELKTFSSPHRYLWPAELDLMARLAGMTLCERWTDWHRTPFTSQSRNHISVWQKTR